MNILFINCNFGMLDVIDCGAANRTTMFVQALAHIGHVDVISFYREKITSNISNCDVVYSEHIPSSPVNMTFWDKIGRKMRLLFKPYDPLTYYPLNKKREDIVDFYYSNKEYDLIACRYIDNAVSCGLIKYSKKLVIDVDDNPANAYKRDMSNIRFRYPGSIIITIWTAYFLGIMSKRLLKRIRCSFYSNILEAPYKKSIFLHNVTTLNEEIADITENTPKRILVVGWLDFFPNRDGVLHFVENIFPSVKSKIPEAELFVIGKCQDLDFIDKLNNTDGVNALGFVENVIEEYRNCRVVIVPVYQGAGSSVKFVEGLMMKRPIVSTPMGTRGFEHMCKDGVQYLLAETDKQFAENVVTLLDSVDKSNSLAKAAYKVGVENYSQERFNEIIKDVIEKCDE